MRLGIYGGTFDPIHNGHIKAAKEFLTRFNLDKLLIIPAGKPPHKLMGLKDDPNRRLEMCRLAFDGDDRIEVSDIEISRTGKNYTVFTLRELKKYGDTMYFLCGADKLHSFNKWYCFEEILEMCTLVFVRRETECNILSKADELKWKYGAKIEILDMDALEMSSTDVREKLRSGEDVSEMLPPAVYKYLICNNLYME